MAKALTKREKMARAAEYVRVTETVPVSHAELRPGMVILGRNGVRRRVETVGEDVRGIFARSVAAWARRSVDPEGGMCYTTSRIDDWGFSDAELVREVEERTGPTMNVCPPDVAHLTLNVERDSIA
jgi:hypothetical protein